MSKIKRSRSQKATNTGSPTNTIDRYFSPSPRNIAVNSLNSPLEDLTLSSPKKKRSKLAGSVDASPRLPPFHFSCPNVNKNQSSPTKRKPSTPTSYSKKSSPKKSVRALFPTPKRKRSDVDDSSSSASNLKIDLNANLANVSPMKVDPRTSPRKKAGTLSAEKFFMKSDDVHRDEHSSESDEEPEFKGENASPTIKLMATNSCNHAVSEAVSPTPRREGLNFFRDVASFIREKYHNLERRLNFSFPICENKELTERERESAAVAESLMAVIQVDSFSDAGIDLTENFLSERKYLSWQLLRHIVYFTMNYCNDEDWIKCLKICFNQLALHPPVSCDMRQYYLLLLDHEEEMNFSQKSQKGFLTYLMEELSERYKYTSPANCKRTRKKNPKYSDYSEIDEDFEDEQKGKGKKGAITPQKGKKNEKKIVSWLSTDDDEIDNSEINETLQNAIDDVGRKQQKILGREILEERQLQLFDFVIRILQVDFLEWSKKWGLNRREKLVSTHESPLVATLMWDRLLGFSAISLRIKEVFHFYVNSEPQHRKYFERFITLMVEVMRIFDGEVTKIDGALFLNFPHKGEMLGEKCRSFADEFFLHCFGSPTHMSATEVHNINLKINTLEPSWLRLHLLNRLLNQTLGSKLTGNLSSVIDVLRAFSFEDKIFEAYSSCKQEQPCGSQQLKETVKTQRTKLRSRGAINKPKDPVGETDLHKACKNKKGSIFYNRPLENLLAVPSVNIMVCDNNGWIPLHEAAYSGNVEGCRMLYEHASTFDQKFRLLSCRSNEGSTPLLEAISKDHIEVAEFLLKVGGSFLLQQIDNTGRTAFDACKSEGMREVLKRYENTPVSKYLSVPNHIWVILFALISSYFETYGTEVCFKYRNLTLSPADFSNVSFPNKKGHLSFILNSSLYSKDLCLIGQLQSIIEMLKGNNPAIKELKLLEIYFREELYIYIS
nr:PREDICTED: uncharacterized protein LOC109032128 [Bemisia tabaci]